MLCVRCSLSFSDVETNLANEHEATGGAGY